MSSKAIIIEVKGRVQGVGFRYYTKKTAEELQIAGFVKNLPNGNVYIEAEGEGEFLDLFVDWCCKGPQWARVLEILISDTPVIGLTEFDIR